MWWSAVRTAQFRLSCPCPEVSAPKPWWKPQGGGPCRGAWPVTGDLACNGWPGPRHLRLTPPAADTPPWRRGLRTTGEKQVAGHIGAIKFYLRGLLQVDVRPERRGGRLPNMTAGAWRLAATRGLSGCGLC